MESTTNSKDYLNQSAVGYMVNTLLSESSQNKIKDFQNTFVSKFQNEIWITPANALHITLLDWIAPLIDYDNDKDGVFEKIDPEYDSVLSSILETIEPINLTFKKILVSPSAVAIVADEKGTQVFNDIRQQFLEKIDLLPNTKQPPNIVHVTIIRFTGAIAVDNVKKFANTLDISLTEQVDDFQLIRETTLPMLEYSVVRTYPLSSAA